MHDSATHSVSALPTDFAIRLLSFFYPVHYRLGMEMEKAMCQGRVDRKQSAMLWLIFSRRNARGWVPRKEIVHELSSWFEISEAKVSRMLQALSTPPHELLTLAESPRSSREKILGLTDEGERFVEVMMAEATRYLAAQMKHLTPGELESGLSFLQKAFGPGRVP